MVKSREAEVVYAPSNSHGRKSHSSSLASEKWNFMSGNLANMYSRPVTNESADQDSESEEIDIRKIFKDIEYLGASNMPWKERKQLENRKVVDLGGKPVKKHRTPLSVAKPAMKNQKKRELKQQELDLILGKFTRNRSTRDSKDRKLKPEERILKTSEGNFRKGVLDVKHLLKPSGSSASKNRDDLDYKKSHKKGKGKGKGKRKGKGKGKGNKGRRKGR